MKWKTIFVITTASIGVLAGLGFATFHYANGTSYLSTDPAACVNCHIMQPQYDSWQKSTHHTVANCVDCHLPHDFVPKYIAKAVHGWNHSKGFTLQDFHEPIRVTNKTLTDLTNNCIRCHGDLALAHVGQSGDIPDCRHCHRDVGHGPRAGLGGPLRAGELETGNE